MPINSLSSRIYAIGILVFAGALLLIVSLVTATERTNSAFKWVNHTQEVIRTVDEMLGDIREAESGQRGFLLTRSNAYLDTFNDRIESAQRRSAQLSHLVEDNPDQHDRAVRLQSGVAAKVDALRKPLALADKGDFNGGIAFVGSGRGRTLMEEVARRADEMKSAEQSLLKIRTEDAQNRAAWNRDLLMIGGPAIVLLFVLSMLMLVASARKPLAAVLASMNAFGQGDLSARAATATGMREFDDLAAAYNQMADQLTAAIAHQQRSDDELQTANGELRAQGYALQTRGEAIEKLGGMAHRMQAARTDSELAEVLRCFLPQVMPRTPGALYIHNNSRTLLTRLAEWGDIDGLPDGFAPQDCWALRRGQGHALVTPGMDVVCAHVSHPEEPYLCEPVLAGGEVIGLLYLKGFIGAEESFRLTVLMENIALALVNHQLQRGLREQSIRDPLTNLFNRRYMEETLEVEIARAARSGAPLSVVMCDVDHFKRFNDTFGHEAGDVLLRAVSALIQTHFRNGDVACRYGGEEFAIIAPGAEMDHLARRAERLGTAIRDLAVHHAGQPLGQVPMSFGIASMTAGVIQDSGTLIRTADAALYQAKHLGRDRVVLADQPMLPLAAE
jgi:diguanylate cyclase (GGDEF)-like protein